MTYKTHEKRTKESSDREEKWERNRKRRNMLTDKKAADLIGKLLRDADIRGPIYVGKGRLPLAPKKGRSYSITRSHYMSVNHPCEVTTWQRYTMPGFCSGNSGGAMARGRTWESCIVDLKRVLREKTA